MKILSMTLGTVGVAVICAAGDRPRLDGRETPRATDLLRAERMAEQVRKRLKMPSPPRSGWEHGGSGWDAPSAMQPDADAKDLIIKMPPPKRRPRPAP